MKTWYQTKVRGERTAESGKREIVTDIYLVDALSFSEAEAMATAHASSYMNEFAIKAITMTNYQEVILDEYGLASQVDGMAQKMLGQNKNASETPDTWFNCKLNFITLDEKTGKEKRTPALFLVHANSVRAAHDLMNQYMDKTMQDYKVEKVVETKILEVLEHK